MTTTATAPARDTGGGVLLALDQLVPDHWPNPRGDVDTTSDKFAELLASIGEQGILEPIVIGAPLLELGGKHAIVAGWRRYTAARELGLAGVPVHQRIDITDGRAALLAALAENMAREDMTPIAEASAIARLVELGMTQTAAAKAVGVSERTARSRLKLLKLPKPVQAAVERGDVPTTCTEQLQLIADASAPAATAIVSQIVKGEVKALDLNSDRLSRVLRALPAKAEVVELGRHLEWKAIGLAPSVLKDLRARKQKADQYGHNGCVLSEAAIGKKLMTEAAAAGRIVTVDGEHGSSVFLFGGEWIERAATAVVESAERRAKRDAAARKKEAADRKQQSGVAAETDPAELAQLARAAAAKAIDKRARPHAAAMNDELGRRLRELKSCDLADPEVATLLIALIHASPHHLPGVSAEVGKYVEAAALPDGWAALPPRQATAALVRLAVAATYCDERGSGKPLGSVDRFPLGVPVPVVFAVAAKLELLPDRAVALVTAATYFNAQTAHHAGRHRRRRILFELTRTKGSKGTDAATLAQRAQQWGRDAGELVDVAMQLYGRDQVDTAVAQLLDEKHIRQVGDCYLITPAGRAALQATPGPAPVIDDIDADAATDDAAPAVPRPARKSRKVDAPRPRALRLITAKPGITIPELAEQMSCAQNMLYRLVPALQADGLVRKDGRGWFPVTLEQSLAEVGAEVVVDTAEAAA